MSDATKKIYLIVPKLIEQSTWGGDYIIKFKNWTKKNGYWNMKVGQSYELFSGSKLRMDISASDNRSFTGELGSANNPDSVNYEGNKNKLLPIQELIDIDPLGVLGSVAHKKHHGQIRILIKFTQALGNSFQMHVKEKNATKRWQAKPESWYYFENGCLTLGIKKSSYWKDYEKTCRDIDKKMKKISAEIKNKKKNIDDARQEIAEYLKNKNPWQYVNILNAKKNDIIDLSKGGVHHSWEKDVINHVHGNIVYELCLDVMDPVSSIRSFDKGNIKDDGSVRDVHIDSYFKLIDRSEKTNNPENHRLSPKIIFKKGNTKIESLLRSKAYCLDKLTLKDEYAGTHTKLNGTYHHLFVKQGEVLISSEISNIKLTKGHSCFIPAKVNEYSIKPLTKETCEILKTFVE